MYYRDPQNPFTTYGDVLKYHPINDIGNPRLLKQKAFVFPILQKNFGEQIKPGSVSITLENTGETLIDDGFGNLISNVSSFNLISLDNNNSIVYYLVFSLQKIYFYRSLLQYRILSNRKLPHTQS